MAHVDTGRDIPQNLFKLASPLPATVLENRRLTPPERGPENDVRHIMFTSPGLSYLPGQSVGVIPEGIDPRTGKPHKLRLYSISSASKGDLGDQKTVSLVVVRYFWDDETTGQQAVPGVCSKYLCDFDAGQCAQLTGPVGKRFLLPIDFQERDMLFIATGTGIAPYRGMLQELFERGYQGRAFLIFGVKYADTLLYDDEFRTYRDRPNFRYVTALSREEEQNPFPDEMPTPGHKLYVHVRMWQHRDDIRPSLAKPDTVVYVCGAKGMEKGIFHVLDLIGEQAGHPRLSRRMQAEDRLLLEVY